MKTNFELLMNVKWYFEIKNLSLKKILEIKAPLLFEQQNELRLYYSQYFVSLLSVIELLSDEKENHSFHQVFKTKLEQQFIFDSYTDGKANYDYLRELRNSVVHRGLDINSSADIKNDIILIISPTVYNRSRKEKYKPFEYYLIDVIKKCELYIPNIIFYYFQELDISKVKETEAELLQESLEELERVSDLSLPIWVKNKAKELMPSINYVSMRKDLINRCFDELKLDLLNIKKI